MRGHDYEYALVAGLSQLAADRLDETVQAMETDLDRLRDEWATTYAEMREASEQRIAATRSELQQQLRAIAAGEAPGPAPANEPPAGGRTDASASTAYPVGHSDPRQDPDPPATELAEAARIKSLSWDDYAAERQSRGIGSPTSARGLFAG